MQAEHFSANLICIKLDVESHLVGGNFFYTKLTKVYIIFLYVSMYIVFVWMDIKYKKLTKANKSL